VYTPALSLRPRGTRTAPQVGHGSWRRRSPAY